MSEIESAGAFWKRFHGAVDGDHQIALIRERDAAVTRMTLTSVIQVLDTLEAAYYEDDGTKTPASDAIRLVRMTVRAEARGG